MSRVLIVGGGCRGRGLADWLGEAGHAVRITTRTDAGRGAIEAAGAECYLGTPARMASLRYAFEGVTLICWLLGSAGGSAEEVAALHGPRLEAMLSQIIDTTVRGVVYEAAGTAPPEILAGGARLVEARARFNAVPHRRLDADPAEAAAWQAEARTAVEELLSETPASAPLRPGAGTADA